ncbi:MAG: tetratricopeptide repeat protein [Silicimonas sp.]|nr:tetratricopeptide repeat protein [Silicimonas sp.]
MGLSRFILVCFLATTGASFAKPLVTSSEETTARLCLARDDTPQRIVAACDRALTDASLTRSQRVELLIARADGHLWQSDHAAAADGYRAAAAADPQSADAWNGLGWALRETEGDAAAYQAFETSLAIDVSVQGLGGKAATGRKSGHLTEGEAREILGAALSIDPEYLWAIREIGWSHLDDGNPESAAKSFGDALAIDATDTNARYGLGRASLKSGDAETALALFNDVLADAPDDFAARVYRIITLRELDRNAQALRDSDRLIADFPTRNSGYIERALSLLALERRAEAIETYVTAEEKLGENNSLLYWHADALATDGQFRQALNVIDRALTLSGADYSDHLLKSYIALEMKDYATTRSAAEASLATGVSDPWAHYYIAISMVHSGETTEGLTQFGKAMAAGLPDDRIGAFAKELVSAGKYVEAAQLRLQY